MHTSLQCFKLLLVLSFQRVFRVTSSFVFCYGLCSLVWIYQNWFNKFLVNELCVSFFSSFFFYLTIKIMKRLPAVRETRVQSLGWEDPPLEKEMATHSSTLAWKIPRTKEPGRLQSMGLQRVGYDWATSHTLSNIHSEHSYIYFIYLYVSIPVQVFLANPQIRIIGQMACTFLIIIYIAQVPYKKVILIYIPAARYESSCVLILSPALRY